MDAAEREEYIDTFDIATFRAEEIPSQKKTFAVYVLLREARKALTGVIVDEDDLQEVTAFLMPQRILLPATRKPRRDSVATLEALFSAKQTWLQEDLFATHGITYDKLVYYIKRMFETVQPASRLWIQFDPVAMSWTLLRKGAQMPRSYTGMVPNGKLTID